MTLCNTLRTRAVKKQMQMRMKMKMKMQNQPEDQDSLDYIQAEKRRQRSAWSKLEHLNWGRK